MSSIETLTEESERRPRIVRLPFHHFWTHEHGLTAFLVFLILVLFCAPVVSLRPWEKLVFGLIFSFTLLSGAVVTSGNRKVTAVIGILVTANLALHWTTIYRPGLTYPIAETALGLCCMAAFVGVTMTQVFHSGRVDAQRIIGAIAAYLLVAWTWAFAYRLVNEISPGAILFDPAKDFVGGPMAHYIYFSFSTLTTSSFGDVYPHHPAARTLAMAEALVGQLYPAILIGRLVGMTLQRSTSRTQTDPD
jgi:hypothetical protein